MSSANIHDQFKKTLSEKCTSEMTELTNCKLEIKKALTTINNGRNNIPEDIDFSKCTPQALKLANCAANVFCRPIREQIQVKCQDMNSSDCSEAILRLDKCLIDNGLPVERRKKPEQNQRMTSGKCLLA